MPQIHDFCAKHPDVQLAIQYSRTENMVDPAAVDVAIRFGQPGAFPDFVAMPILEGAIAPFASDFLQRAGYNDLSDLRRLTLLHEMHRGPWQDWLRRAASLGHSFDPSLARSGMVYPDGHLVSGACLAGEGVALLARDVVPIQLRAKILVSLSTLSIFEDKLYLVLTPRSRPLPRSALVFIQWMQSLPGALKLGVPRS